jgi:beta-lactamase regulating signal transducer with metallopeptidase domain
VLALAGVLRFVLESWRGVCARRAIRRTAQLLETRRVGMLSVRIYSSTSWRGVPFAAGVLRPWLCLPAQLERSLSADEREAVIAHELAHLVHQDLLLLSSTRLLAQALGFVPGARWLARQVQAQCELAADQRATRSVAPPVLASALVRVAELCHTGNDVAAPLSFLRPGRALRQRVELLLATPAGQRPLWLRLSLAALALAMLLRASLFTNP